MSYDGIDDGNDGESLPSLYELTAQVQQLQQTVDSQQARIDELERDVAFYERSIETVEEVINVDGDMSVAHAMVKEHGGLAPWLEALDAADGTVGDETIDELRADLINEQKMRSKSDTNIERKVESLADAVDVDLQDSVVTGEDKIVRLLRYGPDDIVDHAYPVHERAREVLEHAGSWGKKHQDSFGSRIILRSNDVREGLELVRNESLQPKQVRDVFEKLVELAQDSPRKVRMAKTEDGMNKLIIYFTDEEVSR